MELSQEYLLSQYQELGMLGGNENVRLVRNSITGRIAVKKYMKIEQKPVYAFFKLHRNEFIPQTYEYFENGQQLIVIEEYMEGRNLEDILSEQRMSVEEGVRIAKDLCRALYPLHTANPSIICRDLKPENIMLTLENRVKLIDFDIARVVSPGKCRDTVVMGTEGFAAPEQFGRRQTDGRSDIYALGTILNYMILLRFPVEEIVAGELGDVVRRCIAVNPDERYQSVRELELALEKLYPSGYPAKWVLDADGGLSSDIAPDKNRDNISNAVPVWRRVQPPGFRTGKIWKMCLAVMGYPLLIEICLTMEVREGDVLITGIRAWLQRILMLLAQLAEVGLIFNYLGFRDKILFFRTKNRPLRIAGYVIAEFVFITLAVILWVLADIFV